MHAKPKIAGNRLLMTDLLHPERADFIWGEQAIGMESRSARAIHRRRRCDVLEGAAEDEFTRRRQATSRNGPSTIKVCARNNKRGRSKSMLVERTDSGVALPAPLDALRKKRQSLIALDRAIAALGCEAVPRPIQ